MDRLNDGFEGFAAWIADDGDALDDECWRCRKPERVAELHVRLHRVRDTIVIRRRGELFRIEAELFRDGEGTGAVDDPATGIDPAVEVVELPGRRLTSLRDLDSTGLDRRDGQHRKRHQDELQIRPGPRADRNALPRLLRPSRGLQAETRTQDRRLAEAAH
jgi:hypothetical protein